MKKRDPFQISDDDSRIIDRDYSIGGGVTMIRKDFPHGFEKAKPHLQDEEIINQIHKKLSEEKNIDTSDINISILDGIVHLQGWVDSREDRLEAEYCVEEVFGIEGIQNDLHIRNRFIESGDLA
jgi:osmotically-inducible protein OsmY